LVRLKAWIGWDEQKNAKRIIYKINKTRPLFYNFVNIYLQSYASIVQRVNSAKLFIDNSLHCQINKGILALIGIHRNDDEKTINWMINKIH